MTKTLKPVLALSIAALTLLAGCAKGDANTCYSQAKKDIKSQYAVKKFGKAFFVHSDVNKYLKTDGKDLSEDAKASVKEKGNSVSVTYTFDLKDGTECIYVATYTTKAKEFNNISAGLVTVLLSRDAAYTQARESAEKSVDADYQTFGDLKK